MAARPSWSGFLRLSLVSVPVRAYPALVTGGGEIHLNQLHDKCHSRIRYQKVCPIHGEVSNDEIVMGYQYAKDQYVEIEESEREKARTKSDKSIDIDKFVPLDAVDPIYFQGRNYFLLPDGAGGQKPYALLYKAMEDEGRCAVAEAAFSGRDQVVIVRPEEGMLVMYFLNFESQIKSREDFADEVPHVKLKADELKLAKSLLESTFEDSLDMSDYKDTYTDKLKEIIEAKVEGHEVIEPPAEEVPHVVNLMDALRKSVARTKERKSPKKTAARHKATVKRRSAS